MEGIKPKFDIGDKVEILPIQVTGRVLAYYITKSGIEYNVRYFDNAESHTIYFYDDELVRVKAD